MVDFAQARRTMVDCQIRTSDVTDLRVIAAFLDVARERFVPAARKAIAYLDRDVPVSDTVPRALLKPMVFAKLVQAAEIAATDRVLDVGCATGYSSAVLGKLAASVVALEEDAALARTAAETLAGARNVAVVSGPLRAGWPDELASDHRLAGLAEAAVLHAGRPTVVVVGAGAGKITASIPSSSPARARQRVLPTP